MEVFNLGERLRQLRMEKAQSLKEIAGQLGVSLTTYREWEEGRRVPAEYLPNLANIHSVSITALLGLENEAELELKRALSQFESGIKLLRQALNKL